MVFPKPTPKDPRAKKPSPQNMDDEEYAAAWEDYRLYCHELDIYREFEYIRKDFAFVVSCFSELYGEELFQLPPCPSGQPRASEAVRPNSRQRRSCLRL